MLLALLACTAPPETDSAAPVEEQAECTPAPGPPPTTILLVSVDTLNRDFLGVHAPRWDVTPRIDALMAEGTRLDHVIVPRGLSGPSMASLVTGAYPRTHGIRENDLTYDPQGPSDATPTIGERLAAAGYATYGYSANQCYILDEGMEQACTWAEPDLTQAQGDALLVDELLLSLGERAPDEPVFAWLHLLDPHDPYVPAEPWFSTFHPEPYDGPYKVDTEAAIEAYMAGELPYGPADREFVEAVYASQIASTDANIGRFLDGLAAMGRLDDAVVAFAIDHGDALALRDTYFYHGCSPYNTVLDTTYAIWAPGRVPADVVLSNPVSSVDLAPTLIELAGQCWSGPGEGVSLLPDLTAMTEPVRSAWFERGTETAGVVSGDWKYFFDPNAGFDDCKFYMDEPYPNEMEELYRIRTDPLEQDNRASAEPALRQALRTAVCSWVNRGDWVDVPDGNALVAACR